MKISEFKLLQPYIEKVTIYGVPGGSAGGWEIWPQMEEDDDHTQQVIEARRGGRRTWATAEAALGWLLSQRYAGKIEVDVAAVAAEWHGVE